MNPILLDLGFVKIYWYSFIMLISFIVGGSIVLRETKKFKIPDDYMENLIIFLLIFSVIGARIYYVLFNLSNYSDNIINVFKVWEGGLAIHGAIIAGLLWIIIYTRKYKVNTIRMTDIVVVGLIIGQAIGRWGNFFNSEAHGPATTLENLQNLHIPKFIIEGMNIYGTYYHPTFLYESLWCLVGFVALILFRRRYYTKIGQLTGLYMVWYGTGRFLIERMRTDSLMFGNLKIAQIVSILMILAGIILIIVKNGGSKLINRYNDMENLDEIRF